MRTVEKEWETLLPPAKIGQSRIFRYLVMKIQFPKNAKNYRSNQNAVKTAFSRFYLKKLAIFLKILYYLAILINWRKRSGIFNEKYISSVSFFNFFFIFSQNYIILYHKLIFINSCYKIHGLLEFLMVLVINHASPL